MNQISRLFLRWPLLNLQNNQICRFSKQKLFSNLGMLKDLND